LFFALNWKAVDHADSCSTACAWPVIIWPRFAKGDNICKVKSELFRCIGEEGDVGAVDILMEPAAGVNLMDG